MAHVSGTPQFSIIFVNGNFGVPMKMPRPHPVHLYMNSPSAIMLCGSLGASVPIGQITTSGIPRTPGGTFKRKGPIDMMYDTWELHSSQPYT